MSIIPKKIYQSWKTKEVPEKFKENVEKIKELNPDYEYYLYDDEDCRQYLKENYSPLHAFLFDNLIHGAFKCDFWRYAILAKEGGIYMDLDDMPLVPFDEIISPSDTFVSISDRSEFRSFVQCGIYQAFLACSPDNVIMKQALELTFANLVNQKSHYRTGILDITGPAVLGRALNIYWNNVLTTQQIKPGRYDGGIVLFSNMDLKYILDENGKKIIQCKNGVNGIWDFLSPSYYGNADRFYKFGTFSSDSPKSYYEFYTVFIILLLFIVILSTPTIRQFVLWFGLALLFAGAIGSIDYTRNLGLDEIDIIHTIYDGKLSPSQVDAKIRQVYPTSQILIWKPELLKHFVEINNLQDVDDEDIPKEILKRMGGKFYDFKTKTIIEA